MRHRLISSWGSTLATLLWAGTVIVALPKSVLSATVLPLSAKVEGRGYAELSAQW